TSSVGVIPYALCAFFFFSSRRRHTRFSRDWSSDVCSSDLVGVRHGQALRLNQSLANVVQPGPPMLAHGRQPELVVLEVQVVGLVAENQVNDVVALGSAHPFGKLRVLRP